MGNAFDANGGPFELKNDPGNKDLVMIKSGPTAPLEGMEIVFPYYTETVYDAALERNLTRPMEGTIYKVTSNGANHYNVFVTGGLETRIKEKNGTHVICYYMSRFAYVVENGELRLYSTSVPPPGVTWPVPSPQHHQRGGSDTTGQAVPADSPDYVAISLTTEDDRYKPKLQGSQHSAGGFCSDSRPDFRYTMNTLINKNHESGSTIVVALFTTLILGAFVAIAVDYTGNIGRNAQRDRVFGNAVEIGDGCLD